jgi:pimeloyl-ACP methyl ester carboxylesterase
MKRMILRVLALLGAAVIAVAAWVGAAVLFPGFAFLALVALAAFVVAGYFLLGGVDRASGTEDRSATVWWLVGGVLAYVIVAHLSVGRAPEQLIPEPLPSDEVAFWALPDGGEVAYLHTLPAGASTRPPVLVLHGGPGHPWLPSMLESGMRPFDFLARVGYPVYYYDQRGAGFSSRLDLRRGEEYTVDGHVADLEAIREGLEVEQLILVGHGWGATLATQYLLAHPERVERIVALSPTPLWYPAFEDMVDPAARARISDVQASALALMERPPLRLVIGRLTATTSRAAAHSLVEDWEADQWWTLATEEGMRLGQPNMTCSTDPARGLPPISGLGFFAFSYTSADALQAPDPRPALARTETPVLVVRGLCDYIRWQVAYEYLQVMLGAQYVSIPAGGHLIWVEQQELMETVVLPFMADEVVPLSYYHPGRSR